MTKERRGAGRACVHVKGAFCPGLDVGCRDPSDQNGGRMTGVHTNRLAVAAKNSFALAVPNAATRKQRKNPALSVAGELDA